MRLVALALAVATLVTANVTDAQTRKTTPKRSTPAKKAPEPEPIHMPADVTCSSELGIGITTRRRFCDVLTGTTPTEGVLVAIPPHRGPVTISFELHNRHT